MIFIQVGGRVMLLLLAIGKFTLPQLQCHANNKRHIKSISNMTFNIDSETYRILGSKFTNSKNKKGF